MRASTIALLGVLACRAPSPVAPPSVAPTPAPAPAVTTVPIPEQPVPAPVARPPVYTADGWTRSPDDLAAPIVRVVALEADDAMLATVLDAMPSIMACHEVALITAPTLMAELEVRRHPADISGPPRYVFDGEPIPFVACTEPSLRATLAPLPSAQDAAADRNARVDRGLVVIRAYPTLGEAPKLRVERNGEAVTERAGAGCWVREDFPCKPHKDCMAPRWEPVLCPSSSPDPSPNP